MKYTLGSNITSLLAQRNLADVNNRLSKTYERLSSGMRINRASDDAAGLSIADSLRADGRVLSQGVRNLNDGISLLNIAAAAIEGLNSVVIRIRELATQSANGTLSATQRQALDSEAQALSEEYSRIIKTTEFNDRQLLSREFGTLVLQAGYGTEAAIGYALGGMIGDGSMATSNSYISGEFNNTGVGLADLNGDGNLDLVTSGYDQSPPGVSDVGYITVRLGTGSGTFSAITSYQMDEYRTNGMDLADLNNDGNYDVITTGRDTVANDTVTVRYGSGDGSFGAAATYDAPNVTWAVKAEDLNGDGYKDIASAQFGGTITVRLANGDGSYGAGTDYSTGTAVSNDLTFGDLNGDGKVDLVATGRAAVNNGYATVHLANGNGTFAAPTSFLMESYASYGVALADLNGDGILDMGTTGMTGIGGDGQTSIRIGTGDGDFGNATYYAAESRESQDIEFTDLNGDGIQDLVTSGRSDTTDGYLTIRLGNGNGTFQASTSYATEGNISQAVVAGDVNRDGVADLVTAGTSDVPTGQSTVWLAAVEQGTAPLLPFSLATIVDAKRAMSLMDDKLGHLGVQQGVIGAFMSRVEVAVNMSVSLVSNYAEAEARIRDADIAQEAAEMTRLQILQQAAAAILAQANQQPALVLQLLEN